MSRRRVAVVLVLLALIAGSVASPVLTLAQRISPAGTGAITPDTVCLDGGNADTCLARDAAGTLAQKNGANAQALRVYGTTTGPKYLALSHDGSNALMTTVTGSGTLDIRTGDTQTLWLGTNAGRRIGLDGTTGAIQFNTDNTQDLGSSNALRPRALFLAQPAITIASGTGITLNDSGSARDLVYKITLLSTAYSAAALTADATIATLPAKTLLKGMWVDVTTKFIGGAVSAATHTCGTAAGGAQYIASFDIFTAAITRGLADADMGTLLVRAAAIQGGTMPSFSATQIVTCRVTTVTANTNALTQGTVTYYLWTVVLP